MLRDNPKMNYRALIFDDNKSIRQILWFLFDSRDYEVFTFPHPGLCPLAEEDTCPCPKEQSCSDIIISDVQMPFMNGLDFVAEQIKKGCRCKNIALISGAFKEEHWVIAKELNLTLFEKPFRVAEIKIWVDQIEKEIDPQRRLADWYLSKVQNNKEII